MTWERMARLLEASDTLTPTQQIRMIGNALENFENKGIVLSILDKDNLTANNLGLAKAKKWLAKIFDVFESEIDGLLAAHNDLGDAIYYLDVSAEAQNKDGISLRSAKLILEFNCGKIDSDVFTNLEEYQLSSEVLNPIITPSNVNAPKPKLPLNNRKTVVEAQKGAIDLIKEKARKKYNKSSGNGSSPNITPSSGGGGGGY